MQDRSIKTILTIRDPRAIVVSNAFYIKKDRNHYLHPALSRLSRTERIKLLIVGDQALGIPSIKYHFSGFIKWAAIGSFVLKFEDIIGSSGGGSSAKQRETIESLYTFIDLKEPQIPIETIQKNLFFRSSQTFRKGSIDSWKEEFSEEFEFLLKENMGSLLIQLDYN